MRCFTAIELSETWRGALFRACAPLRTRFPRLRWVAPHNLHLTLEFLGEVTDAVVATISARYARVARAQSAFDLALTAPGAFPNFARPRVFWWGAADAARGVAVWSAAARTMLADAKIPLDPRPIAPHITLARIRDPADARNFHDAVAQLPALRIPPTPVTTVTLFESQLAPGGAHYFPLARFPLGGDAAAPAAGEE